MSTPSWSPSWPALARWRRFFWRARWPLAIAYLAALGGLIGGVQYYRRDVPHETDLGATIALRSFAYQHTFTTVEEARADVERGRPERAITRLESFLARHGHVQSAQLYTHAVTDASELLADLSMRQGRAGRATELLESAIQRTPLNYWLWYRLGQLLEERGDLGGATDALREAFKQTLVHPDIAAAYVDLLSEQGLHEDVAWAADHFERARARIRPFVQARAGPPRSALQRRVMNAAGIPIEQGRFLKNVELLNLERGPDCEVVLPRELFHGLPTGRDVYVLLRFQNVFEGLEVTGLTARLADGGSAPLPFGPDRVEVMHRAHSGGDWYVETRTALPETPLADVVVHYSCPEAVLPAETLARVASARRNLEARSAQR